MELSTRAKNAIKNWLFDDDGRAITPEEVAKVSHFALANCPGIGKATVAEVERWLEYHGKPVDRDPLAQAQVRIEELYAEIKRLNRQLDTYKDENASLRRMLAWRGH